MKKLCIVFRHGPHGNAKGREALDLALLSASFEQEVSVLFTNEGVLHLLDKQTPELIGAKDYIATLGALPLYEVETILVCKDSLKALCINEDEIKFDVEFFSAKKISAHFQEVDEVLVF